MRVTGSPCVGWRKHGGLPAARLPRLAESLSCGALGIECRFCGVVLWGLGKGNAFYVHGNALRWAAAVKLSGFEG